MIDVKLAKPKTLWVPKEGRNKGRPKEPVNLTRPIPWKETTLALTLNRMHLAAEGQGG
jgi:hypothetical protein